MTLTHCVHRLWKSYLSHPLLWHYYPTTRHKTDSTTSILVSCLIRSAILTLHLLSDDDTRVCLKEVPGEEGSDYINASFIDVMSRYITQYLLLKLALFQGYGGKRHAYIAAQGIIAAQAVRYSFQY